MLFSGSQDVVDVLFDSDVDDLVAVVGEDDVDKVLPNVVDVTTDGGQDHGAFTGLTRFLHVWLQ